MNKYNEWDRYGLLKGHLPRKAHEHAHHSWKGSQPVYFVRKDALWMCEVRRVAYGVVCVHG